MANEFGDNVDAALDRLNAAARRAEESAARLAQEERRGRQVGFSSRPPTPGGTRPTPPENVAAAEERATGAVEDGARRRTRARQQESAERRRLARLADLDEAELRRRIADEGKDVRYRARQELRRRGIDAGGGRVPPPPPRPPAPPTPPEPDPIRRGRPRDVLRAIDDVERNFGRLSGVLEAQSRRLQAADPNRALPPGRPNADYLLGGDMEQHGRRAASASQIIAREFDQLRARAQAAATELQRVRNEQFRSATFNTTPARQRREALEAEFRARQAALVDATDRYYAAQPRPAGLGAVASRAARARFEGPQPSQATRWDQPPQMRPGAWNDPTLRRQSAGGGGREVIANIDAQMRAQAEAEAQARRLTGAYGAQMRSVAELSAVYGENVGAIDAHIANTQAAIDVENRMASRLAASRQETQRSVVQMGAFSNAYRKHGAATTEFLTAMGRGETSIREIGYQALATAGKFGAWTAASTGVFALIGSLQQVGTGAISSLSGINEASRFINDLDTSRAQQQFRDLSREFNLPIDQVTEAFSQMGRVFNTQAGAMQGARAVLLATRVGELQVADSTRFLGAIVQGFRLPAGQLTTVIDQINSAQNNLNFSIRDGAAGIARAAGSWRAAGGDFSSLLAIMATAQRSTGATGEVVGTAFRRSAEFIGREANQTKLRGFGIDPTRGVADVYEQAFSAVQSGRVRGQDVTRLAAALSSPQLAAVIGPTLQNFDLYRKALRETSAEASRGSGQRELAIQLDSVRERVARVGNEFQRLGSNLGQAGVLDPLGGVLLALTQILSLTNRVAETFNLLPDGVRRTAMYAVALYGTMRLLRRLNVGSTLMENAGRVAGDEPATGRAGLRQRFQTDFLGTFGRGVQSPANAAARQLQRDLRQESAFYRQEQENLSRRIALSRLRVEGAQAAVEGVARERPVREQFGSDPEFIRAQGQHDMRLVSYQQQVNEAEAELSRMQAEHERIQQKAVDLTRRDRDFARTRNRLGDQAMLDEAAANAVHHQTPVAAYSPTFERPTTDPVRDLRAGVGVPRGTRAEAARAAEESVASAGIGVAEGVAEGVESGTNRLHDEGRRSASRAARLGARARVIGAGMRTAAVGLGAGLASLFGPIELIIAGMLIIPEVVRRVQERRERARNALQQQRAVPRTAEEDAARVQRAQEAEDRRADAVAESTTRQSRQRRLSNLFGLSDRGRRIFFGTPVAPPETDLDRQNQAVLQQRRYIEQQQRAAQRARRPVPFQYISQIFSQVNEQMLGLGDLPRDQQTGRAAQIYRDAYAAIGSSMENFRGFKRIVADAQRDLAAKLSTQMGREGAWDATRAAPLAEIATMLNDESQIIATFGPSRDRLGRSMDEYIAAAATLGRSHDPEALKQFQAVEDAFNKTLQDTVTNFQQQFRSATTPRGQAQAVRATLRQLPNVASARGRASDYRDDVRRAEEEQRRAQAAVATARTAAARVRGPLIGRPGALTGAFPGLNADQASQANLGARQDALERANRRLARARSRSEGADDAVKRAMRQRSEAIGQIIDSLTSGSSLIDAQLALDNARTANPVRQAQNTERAALDKERQLESLISEGLVSRGDVLGQLLTLQANAAQAHQDVLDAQRQAAEDRLQRIDDQLARMEARSAPRISALPERRRGGATLTDLRNRLAYAQEHGARDETIWRLQDQINQQEDANAAEDRRRAEEARQRAEAARQRRITALTSLYDLLRSRTDDPVAQATLTAQEQSRLLGIPGQSRADRRGQEAQRNTALRSRSEALRDRAIEEAQLQVDIGQASKEHLLAVMERALHDTTTGVEYRRQLRARYLRLKHDTQAEGDFNLDVGAIRMPTVYDVRNALRPVRDQIRRQVANARAASAYDLPAGTGGDTHNVDATVNVYVNDVNAAGQVYTQIDRAMSTTLRAQMRSRGMR